MDLGKFENAQIKRQEREIELIDAKKATIEKRVRDLVEKYKPELERLNTMRQSYVDIIELIKSKANNNTDNTSESMVNSAIEPIDPVNVDVVDRAISIIEETEEVEQNAFPF